MVLATSCTRMARGRVLVVDTLVLGVRDLTGAIDQNAVVRTHAGVDHADVWGYEGDF